MLRAEKKEHQAWSVRVDYGVEMTLEVVAVEVIYTPCPLSIDLYRKVLLDYTCHGCSGTTLIFSNRWILVPVAKNGQPRLGYNIKVRGKCKSTRLDGTDDSPRTWGKVGQLQNRVLCCVPHCQTHASMLSHTQFVCTLSFDHHIANFSTTRTLIQLNQTIKEIGHFQLSIDYFYVCFGGLVVKQCVLTV